MAPRSGAGPRTRADRHVPGPPLQSLRRTRWLPRPRSGGDGRERLSLPLPGLGQRRQRIDQVLHLGKLPRTGGLDRTEHELAETVQRPRESEHGHSRERDRHRDDRVHGHTAARARQRQRAARYVLAVCQRRPVHGHDGPSVRRALRQLRRESDGREPAARAAQYDRHHRRARDP